jgi:hypothetical protein
MLEVTVPSRNPPRTSDAGTGWSVPRASAVTFSCVFWEPSCACGCTRWINPRFATSCGSSMRHFTACKATPWRAAFTSASKAQLGRACTQRRAARSPVGLDPISISSGSKSLTDVRRDGRLSLEARCRACAPLFPKRVNGTGRTAATEPVSRRRQQVTNAVLKSLRMIGVDTSTQHYSGISMRRGGISAGLAARVPEPILFLQSGHGSNCAARNYIVPRDPHVLYETYLALGLGL